MARPLLSPRAKRLHEWLTSDPRLVVSFADVAERYGTSASGAVMMVRSLAKAGLGDFRDRVMGEQTLYDAKTCADRAAARKERGFTNGSR